MSDISSRNRPQHAVCKLACPVLSSAKSCHSRICPGRLSTAWLVSLVVFSSSSSSSSYSSSHLCSGQRFTPHIRTLDVRPGRVSKKLGIVYDNDLKGMM